MIPALLSACAMLLVGFVLRARLRILQVLFIPAAVIGGLLGLVVVQAALRLEWAAPRVSEVVTELGSWPGHLIAVIFAALLLSPPRKSAGQEARLVARQGLYVWIIVVGEVVIGLTLVWLIIGRFYDVPAAFGQLIEVGFAGGHGAAAAMGVVFEERLDFPAGRDLVFFVATFGLIWSVISGLVLVNIGVRRGWTRGGAEGIPLLSGLEARHAPTPMARARVRSEVIDPLVFQGLILAAAFAIGLALQAGVIQLGHGAERVLGGDEGEVLRYVGNLPPFMFTLLGGLLVSWSMRWLGIADLIDVESIQRLGAAAMELLIVSALASLRPEALVAYAAPVLLLLGAGSVWAAFCLLVIARRVLPPGYWFELGILNYGMSTGTTAQGILLLRIVDKDLSSGAAEDYALAAPLSAPFIGGGIITFSLPLIMLTVEIWAVAAVMAAVVVACYLIARRIPITASPTG